MSDPLKKVKDFVQIKVSFDPNLYRSDPASCISYELIVKESSLKEVPIEDLRALELALRTVATNVIKPEIARKVRLQKLGL